LVVDGARHTKLTDTLSLPTQGEYAGHCFVDFGYWQTNASHFSTKKRGNGFECSI